MALTIDSPQPDAAHAVVKTVENPNRGHFCASGEADEAGLTVLTVRAKCFATFDPEDEANAEPPIDSTVGVFDLDAGTWLAPNIGNARCEDQAPLPTNILAVWFQVLGQPTELRVVQFKGAEAQAESC